MPVCVTIRMVTIGKLIVIVTARARSAHRAPRDKSVRCRAGLSRGIPYPISGHAYNKAPIYHNHDTFLWAEPMQNRPSTPSDAASALLSALWLCDHPTPMPGRLPPRNCLHGGFSRGLLV